MKIHILIIPSLLVPGIALAQFSRFSNVGELLNFFTDLIRVSIIPLLIALAVVYFLYGAGKFIRNAEDTGKREEGRQFMLYGVIALFVIVSFWGIVTLLANTFGIGIGGGLPQFPSARDCSDPSTLNRNDRCD